MQKYFIMVFRKVYKLLHLVKVFGLYSIFKDNSKKNACSFHGDNSDANLQAAFTAVAVHQLR